MTSLDTIIQAYKDAAYFPQLKEHVLASAQLSGEEKELFEKICSVASEFENWNYSDLRKGIKVTKERLKDEFHLSDEASVIIARIASYDWK